MEISQRYINEFLKSFFSSESPSYLRGMGQKGRKRDVSPHSGRNLRLKFIHEFVCGEQGNQTKMLGFVNRKLIAHGLEKIGKATLQADISYLNSGDYLTSEELKNYKPFKDGKYFHAKLNKVSGSYFYEDEIKPPLSFLTEEEQMTLPFLTSLLASYSDIPAFNKFLQQAATLFDEDLKKIQHSSAFTVTGPVFKEDDHKSKMIHNLLKLLRHIQQEEVIVFDYLKPNTLDIYSKTKGTKFHVVFKPLCIRLYQNLYYLFGIREGSTSYSLTNYRIDLIEEGSIKTIPKGPDTLKVKTFSSAVEKSKSNFNEAIKVPLGVWNHAPDCFEEKITLRFHGWAAKHLLTFKIHHSQHKIHTNESPQYADFEFKLYTYNTYLEGIEKEEQSRKKALADGTINAEKRPYINWLNRYPEAGYIFGRYINFIEFMKIESI